MNLLDTGRPRIVVDDDASCRRLLERLSSVDECAVDLETDGNPNRSLARPTSMQLYWGKEEVFINEPYLPRLKPWLDDKPTGYFYGAKGDLWPLGNSNIKWKGEAVDVMLEDYLVNENVKVQGTVEESLKDRHGKLFQHPPRLSYAERFKEKGKPLPGGDALFNSPRREEFLEYACADAVEAWEVHLNRQARLKKLPWKDDLSMNDYLHRYSVPYTRVLYNMERRGCHIDTEFLEELHVKATGMLEDIEHRFYKEARKAGGDLEAQGFTEKLLGSWQQIGRLFYDVIGYPEQFSLTKNKLGQRIRKRTSNEAALERLAQKGYPLAKILMERRKIAKLHGTYVEGMLREVWMNRLHTDFQQAFTLTGRLSSRDPNLQNIPRPETDPFGIRYAFIPTPGFLLVSLDYSQIETRLMAHLSNDPAMIGACEESDIYEAMAMFLFNKPAKFFAKVNGERSPEAAQLRQVVKAIVLGVGYGKQAKSIASDLGITETEADKFMAMYFGRFPRFRGWMKSTSRKCRDRGFVRTIHGRYRNISEIRSDDKWRQMRAERQAINSVVQGSAFDIIQKAQLNIASSGIEKEYGCFVILSVHDELLVEGPPDVLKKSDFIPRVREMMEHPFDRDLRVKTPTAYKIGTSWGEIH